MCSNMCSNSTWQDENVSKMSSTTIFDFYVGIVCTFESSQIAASGENYLRCTLDLNSAHWEDFRTVLTFIIAPIFEEKQYAG